MSVSERTKNMANREKMVMDLCSDNERVQYDGDDEARIAGVTTQFTQVAMLMIEALGQYNVAAQAPVDENSVDIMKGARADVVMSWAALQVVTSKIAGILRIDGDEAFKRILAVAHTPEDPDVSGL
jgi:hypothetical protein